MNYPSTINHLLALHEMFRRLGFSSDQLFVLVYVDALQFELRVGPPEALHDDAQVQRFGIDVPNDERIPTAELHARWLEATDWWNNPSTPDQQRAEVMARSQFSLMAVPLITALTQRGLYPLPKATT